MSTLADDLKTWQWRFSHLYWIKPAEGAPAILFIPRPQQLEILEDIYERGHVREAILKARQLGFSTLLATLIFTLLGLAGTAAALVLFDAAWKWRFRAVRAPLVRGQRAEGQPPRVRARGGVCEIARGGG